ncbi:unnamed protein product [Didymodactylos carnosus]|uniref:Diacylglycerol kinase n=1 Tax=Didymodactylos carnosus TaxID=1234261 RepID=A0A813RNH6_9BILA|nr:unnamed protein product [Didymodactylos carnosus]CAF3568520.1 unnamed protein product [Didymodactylos carnosus]
MNERKQERHKQTLRQDYKSLDLGDDIQCESITATSCSLSTTLDKHDVLMSKKLIEQKNIFHSCNCILEKTNSNEDDQTTLSSYSNESTCQKIINEKNTHSHKLLSNENLPENSIMNRNQNLCTVLKDCVVYGVDWSFSAQPHSHCWYPCFKDNLNAYFCQYYNCINETFLSSTMPNRNNITTNTNTATITNTILLQCASCSFIIHSHHLLSFTPQIPSCRLTFIDNKTDSSSFDKHFWIPINLLTSPCNSCKRKTNLLFTRPMSTAVERYKVENSTRTTMTSKYVVCGIKCVWCSRIYHKKCFEKLSQSLKTDCDYGTLRNIIVRPQCIRKYPDRFKAINDDKTSNTDSPLLVFINRRSGGQTGEKIYKKLLKILNPRQIFLLENNQTILNALEIYSDLPNIRICVFGGDGSIGWVLATLVDFYHGINNPPVGICPIGTGNDLSRVLGWGDVYDSKRLLPILLQIPKSHSIPLDRWHVVVEPFSQISTTTTKMTSSTIIDNKRPNKLEFCDLTHRQDFLINHNDPKFVRQTNRPSYLNHRTLPNSYFINYMSFGLDAAIALEFHDKRTREPEKFSSPFKNKLMYLNESRKYMGDFTKSKRWDLSTYIKLTCDNRNYTDSIRNCHTLIVLNIPGYASGTNPWGKQSTPNSSLSTIRDFNPLDRISSTSINLSSINESYKLLPLNKNSSELTATATPTSLTFSEQNFSDKKLEVVGLSTMHMGLIHVGFSGIRIAQCSQVQIEIETSMTAQLDGEPFYLQASNIVKIKHSGQVMVLRYSN